MLFRDDVIDLATEKGVVFINQAVFAAVISASLNKSPQLRVDVTRHSEERRRARAFANRIRCSSFV